MKCPACGETNARHQVARSEYPSIAPQVVGGVALALVFELSRRRRFRCEACSELFLAHTFASRLWGGLCAAFFTLFALGFILIFIGIGKH